MENEPKPNLTGLIAGVILLPIVLLTASCSGTTSHERQDTACTDVGESVYQCDITLNDGRKITCVKFGEYQVGGGKSCDWNHAGEEDAK